MISIPEYIESRVRQRPPAGVPVVPGSTPVVAFGNVQTAKVATFGLNPSNREFLDAQGNEMTGAKRRLETLTTLGESDLSSASPDVIRRVVEGCNGYFQRCPYKVWFDVLEKVLLHLGMSYYNGTACHLDLVQWATGSKWDDLTSAQHEALIAADLPFLRQQLSQEKIRLLLLNGRGVADVFGANFGCNLIERALPAISGMKLFEGRTQDGVQVIGWNKTLQHGISDEHIETLAAAIKHAELEP